MTDTRGTTEKTSGSGFSVGKLEAAGPGTKPQMTTQPRPVRVGDLQPCGTRSAAERHLSRGEPLDAKCRDARRRYYRDRKRAARAVNAVDWVVVQRVCDGETLRVNREERLEVVRWLAGHGHSDRQIANRLRMTVAWVCKTRQRHGIKAGVPSTRLVAVA